MGLVWWVLGSAGYGGLETCVGASQCPAPGERQPCSGPQSSSFAGAETFRVCGYSSGSRCFLFFSFPSSQVPVLPALLAAISRRFLSWQQRSHPISLPSESTRCPLGIHLHSPRSWHRCGPAHEPLSQCDLPQLWLEWMQRDFFLWVPNCLPHKDARGSSPR